MSDEETRRYDADEPAYEAPELSVIGSVQALTLGSLGTESDSDGFISSRLG